MYIGDDSFESEFGKKKKKDKNWSIYAGSTITNSFRQLSKIRPAIENSDDYSLVYKYF